MPAVRPSAPARISTPIGDDNGKPTVPGSGLLTGSAVALRAGEFLSEQRSPTSEVVSMVVTSLVPWSGHTSFDVGIGSMNFDLEHLDAFSS